MDLDTFININKQENPILIFKLKEILKNYDKNKFLNFISLIRQIYLSNTKLQNCNFITIPNNIDAEREDWQKYGFEYTEINDKKSIKPSKWIPTFIKNDNINDITELWNKLETHRVNLEIDSDPFVQDATGFDTYTSPVQREALLRMLVMPEGHTLIINLPTGSGKSMLFQIPILKKGLRNGLTLVIVPTISLALDQSRRMIKLLKENNIKCDHELAWYGDLEENQKNQIKENIKIGKQGILFVSPEAVVGALLPSLFIAASKGLFNYFCIDEAHLLIDWGDTFRPDYHSLTAVRNGLLHSCKEKQFRTLLFSATFTSASLQLIDVLFKPKENINLVSGIYLRPEPQYFMYKVNSKDEQRNYISEILNFVPKPILIYTTLVEDAEKIYKDILNKNYLNAALFHGRTSTLNRSNIITDWLSDKLDVVIATSAFGVGVDKPNVRTVIHATIPETLDRFYQEVGRAGRDGQSAISILLHTDEDRETALDLATDKKSTTAGFENAYNRWNKMILNSKPVKFNDADFFSIDLKAPGPGLKQETDANTNHNLMTLIIMSRSGLITLFNPEPNYKSEINEYTNTNFEQFWNNYYSTILVKINDDNLSDFEYFKLKYNSSKSFIKNNRIKSLEVLLDIIDKKSSVEKGLDSIFSSYTKNRELLVTSVCRGCHSNCSKFLSYKSPKITGKVKTIDFKNSWHDKWPENSKKIILYPNRIAKITDYDLKKAVEIIIIHYDVKQILIDETMLNIFKSEFKNLLEQSNLILNTIQYFNDKNIQLETVYFNLPTVTVLFPWDEESPIPENLFEKIEPFNIILAPENLRSFSNYKRLSVMDPNLTEVSKFISKETN